MILAPHSVAGDDRLVDGPTGAPRRKSGNREGSTFDAGGF